jgi:2-oxoglutarate dehydrogenase E1 component/2-oxoglutarate decarboxylase
MQVADVTTAAQFFHLLRRQVLRSSPKPLVVFTPKRYLRARETYSQAADFAGGHFQEVLKDGDLADQEAVRRVVLATGKVAVDLTSARARSGRSDVAVLRVEQLYPWPADQIVAAVADYPRAEAVVWLQEEPENMGGWGFVRDRLADLLGSDFYIDRVTRVASGSPATGSHALHELEQANLLARALGDSA